MRARRIGYTVVEIVVVVMLVTIVLAIFWQIFSGSTRMNQAATMSVAIQQALIVQETLAKDIKRLGIPPGAQETMRINPASISFYITQFQEGDPVLKLNPVRYSLKGTPNGNMKLVREIFDRTGPTEVREVENVTLDTFTFNLLADPTGAGRFLIATGTALTEDEPLGTYDPRYAMRAFPVLYLGQIRDPPSLVEPLTRSAGYVVDGLLPDPVPTPEPDESEGAEN